MNKLITIFSLLTIMLFSISTAFAANEKITMMDEKYNLNNIQTLAIYTPNYKPSALSIERKAKLPNAPELITTDKLTDVIFKVAKEDEVPYKLVSDKVVIQNIIDTTGVDITTLSNRDALKLYRNDIKNYADAYVVFTFANDSRVVMFADLYDATDNHWICSYQIVGGDTEDDNLENYSMFMHKFFRTLSLQAQK